MASERVTLFGRIPPGLHRRLKALARRDRRSLNWELEQAVAAWVEQRAAERRPTVDEAPA